MEIRKNSRTSRLFKWFYNLEDYELPNNLCPYFWKVVFMYIAFIPSIILSLPYLILGKFKKGSNHPGVGFLSWFCIFIVFCIGVAFSWFWELPEKHTWGSVIGTVGWMVVVLGISISGVELIKYLSREKGDRKTLIGEYAKAKYNKYCPKIDWK